MTYFLTYYKENRRTESVDVDLHLVFILDDLVVFMKNDTGSKILQKNYNNNQI